MNRKNLNLAFCAAKKIKEVESVTAGKIPFVQEKNTVWCEIPIKDVDVILLRK